MNDINNKRRETSKLTLDWEKGKTCIPNKIRTPVIKSKAISRVLKENSTPKELLQNI